MSVEMRESESAHEIHGRALLILQCYLSRRGQVLSRARQALDAIRFASGVQEALRRVPQAV